MNNARCPKCNIEFETEGVKTVLCPNCGVELDALRARKYFSTFHDKSIERQTSGSDYLKYEDYLRIGSHHLAQSEWEQAKDAYLGAISINAGDYRGYMGLVAVETKNYTDLKNTTHQKFLQKAISVADEEQQKTIVGIYKSYRLKTSMSDEEYSEYLAEKQKDYKARIKKAILGMARVNEQGQKKAKISFILMFVFIGLGAITCVLGAVFDIYSLMLVGLVVMLSSYALTILWQRQKYNEKLYVFLVDLFNGLKSYDFNYEQTEKTLNFIASILLSVRNGDPSSTTNNILFEFADYIVETGNQKAINFFKSQKFTAKYLK